MNLAVISYLLVVFVIVALLVDKLPFIVLIKRISAVTRNSYQIINATDLDDEKKQSLLLSNSFDIFKQSIKIFGLISIIGIIGYVLFLISSIFKPLSLHILNNAMLSVPGLLLSVAAFVSYFLLKKLYVKVRV